MSRKKDSFKCTAVFRQTEAITDTDKEQYGDLNTTAYCSGHTKPIIIVKPLINSKPNEQVQSLHRTVFMKMKTYQLETLVNKLQLML